MEETKIGGTDMDFGRFGFGFLRLPHVDPNDITDVDLDAAKKMVDLFLERGFRYFDTAYTYLNYKSEEFLRQALVERYPRDRFAVATKLPCDLLKRGRTAQEIFDDQLQKCGVEYFDVYLLHGLDADGARTAEKYGAFEFLNQIKARGKAKFVGFSFHDTAEVLDEILTRHPEVDVVQIQLNYLDWDNAIIQSGRCYEVCRKHRKPIIVMEPVKGGTLAKLPEKALPLLGGESPASRAIRFAASQEGVAMVLSGMSTLEQVEENTALMAHFQPLTEEETSALEQVKEMVRGAVAIACTGCSYCTDGCPAGIPVPRFFSLYNERERDGWQANTEERYRALTNIFPPAKACLGCGQCQDACPQKLPIIEHLKTVSAVFDR
jgi:predicted aldo/keto reductase-like oxidoreductase